MAKLRDIEVDDYYKACIDFEPALIDEEFTRLSGDFGYWNEKLADAGKEVLLCEWQEKKTEAQLYLQFKEPAEGKKPPTEAAVEAAIRTHPNYEAVHLKHIEAIYAHSQLQGRVKTISKKADMLVSMGAQLRQEREGDKRIMERSYAERRARLGDKTFDPE
jgi:hypothetical protein